MNKNIGDMSKEELYELCNELLDKDTDYMLLERRIDKAIEYIKEQRIFAKEVENEYAIQICNQALQILGDKENE